VQTANIHATFSQIDRIDVWKKFGGQKEYGRVGQNVIAFEGDTVFMAVRIFTS
jgi:hypothetical protein